MKNTKRKHLKLCLLLLFMVLGCFAITNVRTTTVSADDETSDIPWSHYRWFAVRQVVAKRKSST